MFQKIVKEITLTVEKTPLVLVLPLLWINIKKTRLGNNFHFKDQIPKGVVYKFQCGLCNDSYYDECARLLNVRICEHTGISPLAKEQIKPKNSSDFNILTFENKKFLIELKESPLIMRDRSSLNRNITLSLLYQFGRP